ncbi:potassium-transporting ATPase subunit C (plasmid) [Rhizobium sp. TRM96647]|uniref:potassium-transporting ATPase subunit C n=1 Tax=unclassified Rhizobium TaxID=2613769 RepID=UPI0021E8D416|nr:MULTISPECIES: potassium-transporting ATPase subunit C [unclassified Rhizobium]MCV3735216.1 potassium-transporting ATPase subunit C [Rhizobium sp. TRM96647]MCV3758021.1 potassium-transporting ATPase subunit C [Rhizobium sp. TRM96650]
METLLSSLRIAVATMAICVGGYSAAVWAIGQAVTPDTAEGSLITRADGTVVGSRQVAQAFTQPQYFWPRPSAVDYNGAGAGGSNKSPTSTDLTDRATETVAAYGATTANPLPAELAAASGAGLDPHITERAARYQVQRIAQARNLPADQVERVIDQNAFSPGGMLTSDRLVNVLEMNLALDESKAG